jgi:hypothetical protein
MKCALWENGGEGEVMSKGSALWRSFRRAGWRSVSIFLRVWMREGGGA